LTTDQKFIYESPDGGETVYRRILGSTDRELHYVSDKSKNLHAELKHSKLWGKIHRAAKSDPALQEMINQIEVYYTLKNTP
jgi:hypothetical protein